MNEEEVVPGWLDHVPNALLLIPRIIRTILGEVLLATRPARPVAHCELRLGASVCSMIATAVGALEVSAAFSRWAVAFTRSFPRTTISPRLLAPSPHNSVDLLVKACVVCLNALELRLDTVDRGILASMEQDRLACCPDMLGERRERLIRVVHAPHELFPDF
jgi:hypothetical protein